MGKDLWLAEFHSLLKCHILSLLLWEGEGQRGKHPSSWTTNNLQPCSKYSYYCPTCTVESWFGLEGPQNKEGRQTGSLWLNPRGVFHSQPKSQKSPISKIQGCLCFNISSLLGSVPEKKYCLFFLLWKLFLLKRHKKSGLPNPFKSVWLIWRVLVGKVWPRGWKTHFPRWLGKGSIRDTHRVNCTADTLINSY